MTLLKLILLFLILIASQARSFGQRFPSYLGTKGGVNFSNLSGNNESLINSKYDTRKGTDFEVFIETKINKVLTFQSLGVELSSQGAKKVGFQAIPFNNKYSQYFPSGQLPQYLFANFIRERKLNYLLLTTIFRVHTNAEKKALIKPYVSAGFYSGYLLSAKDKLTGSSIIYKDEQRTQALNSTVESFNYTRDLKTDLHKFNIGLNGSVGLSVDMNKIRIYIECGGNYGLKNVNKQDEDEKNYIKSLSGRLGFSYNIGQVLPRNF